jgi:putative tryptophan/tyrosine transport system substrate-binding protein
VSAAIKRREFITLIGGASVWPLAARAQQGERMRRIGMLMAYPQDDPEGHASVNAFRGELEKLGWRGNMQLEVRWVSPGDVQSRERYADELVSLQPDLIVSHSTPNAAALLQRTRTIPIIFAQIADPVATGLVASFSRPGGNATGFTVGEGSMAGKWVELLKEIAPRVTRAVILFNPATAPYAEIFLDPFKTAGSSLGVEVTAARVGDGASLESVIAAQAQAPHAGIIAMPDSFLNARRAELTALAARHRVPAVYAFRIFPETGGLMSYGIDLLDNYRRAGGYADRILRGAKPSELPVQAPMKLELVINLKAARALGLEVPWFLQQRADEVIE